MNAMAFIYFKDAFDEVLIQGNIYLRTAITTLWWPLAILYFMEARGIFVLFQLLRFVFFSEFALLINLKNIIFFLKFTKIRRDRARYIAPEGVANF